MLRTAKFIVKAVYQYSKEIEYIIESVLQELLSFLVLRGLNDLVKEL